MKKRIAGMIDWTVEALEIFSVVSMMVVVMTAPICFVISFVWKEIGWVFFRAVMVGVGIFVVSAIIHLIRNSIGVFEMLCSSCAGIVVALIVFTIIFRCNYDQTEVCRSEETVDEVTVSDEIIAYNGVSVPRDSIDEIVYVSEEETTAKIRQIDKIAFLFGEEFDREHHLVLYLPTITPTEGPGV